MTSDERYQVFAKDLWKRGQQATESGACRTITARQLSNAQERHGITTFETFNPFWNARFKVNKSDLGVIFVMDTSKV